ncbi:MAG: substrate-binding domain-containing protein [Anaerolineales bacterium]|nr:substrate-binding domain-containing protein [Chloroflexota bacterium]MBL6983757.1 substrate-binding domain-containing protein [Anaerolineales bacterium]
MTRFRPADNCAIIGFDDIKYSAMQRPSLSSIRYDKYAIGQIAMTTLIEIIENPDAVLRPSPNGC